MRSVCGRGFKRTLGLVAVVVSVAAGLALAVAAETIDVVLDRATVLKMPEKVATVVIGNPLIADASLQPGGVMVLTGKGFGATNVLPMDRNGTVLMEKQVQVTSPAQDILIVHRGVLQETYSCNPKCERRVTLGDGKDYFESTLSQTISRTGSAQSGGK